MLAQLNTALEGRYTVERLVGEGGMATVYLARDLRHQRNVALKVLRPDLGAVLGLERFSSEIQVTALARGSSGTFRTGSAMRVLLLMALTVGVARQAGAQSVPAPADSFTVMLAVPSQGDTLRGFIRVAQGTGPHLTVVLLQGFPGSANPALPAVMQAAGFNGVGFNFRGVRASEGFYTVQGTIADAKAMVAFLRSDSARRLWRVDPDRIVLIGASAGTLSAMRATADDPRIVCGAAMVPFNWARAGLAARTDTALRRRMEGTVRNLSSGPQPVLRERGLLDEVIGNAEANDLVPVGAALGNRRVMLIGARDDTTAPLPVHFVPLVEAIRKAGGAGLRDTVVDDTHNLPNAGDAVGAAIVRWLRSECAR